MTPAAFAVQANETAAPTEALRTGSNLSAARIARRPQPRLFNDYGPAPARLFHAWRP